MVELDTLPVEISSISAQATFQFDEETRIIELNSTSDSVEVCYRVLSSLLTNDFKKRDLSIYDEEGVRPIILESTIPAEKESLFEFVGVEKYGAITRGISFGNRQNVFVNSSLNLQMEGKLDENLNISAVITDQNVPYQPEGNTQQIRDFDNVFIKLYNEDFDVTAGDIVLQQPDDGYFLKYYKNIQGLQASVRGGEKWRYESRVSGAQSKGKFNSAIVEPIDGLSGPYKLRGPNGERFIIVLANSEKVFLDGKKLERGFDQDYVIDYNLGEITFNNHIVITQFSVIRVDYEYAEQFYSRSNFSGYQSVENDKIKLYANFYREKDNPNANLGFVLGEDDLLTLGGIGDDVDQAFITGFDSVQFSENRVLYEKKDTTDLDGNLQTIFMFSSDRSQPLFSPTFSDVGIGNGDYVLRNATSNGRVFEWVSPQGGQSQGRYEPGQFVPLPNKRQLVTLGGEVKLSSFETITTEVAFSNRDDNLFSDIDDGDNTSNAYFFSMESKGRQAFANGYEWVGNLSLEYDQKDFTFIDRYRPILFDRDWNFDLNEAPPSEDLILAAKGGMIRDDDNQLLFSINRRSRSDAIDGWQYGVEFDQLINDFKLSSNHFYLQNDQIARNTRWLRTKTDLSFRRWKVVPGYIFEIDDNRISEADSVVSTLMNFRSNEFYLSSGDSTKSTYRIGYKLRQDRLPQAGKLQDYLFSKNLSASYLIRREKARLSVDFNYRKVEDQLELNQGEDEVINGRINWFQHFFDKQLTHDFSLSTGNSRELRREFIYLPVSTGEGTHTWRDLNADGVQDLNEFFEAINPDERNYVKIFTPTDDYVTSFQTFYLHTIDAYMPRSWRGQGGVRSFLSKVSLNVNFNVNFKTTASNYSSRLNPFSIDLDDTDVISSRDIKRYTFFFNRNGRGFGADFTRQTSDNKQLLVQGFEIREKEEWISNFKVDLSAAYTFRLTTMLGKQLNRSDFLDSRNFEIASGSFKPQLIWQPTNVLRLIGSYERRSKQNDLTESSDESVLSQYYTGELTWNQSTQGSIRASVSYVKIDFTGDPSTYLGYLLLDALQPGSNQTWQVNWQQRISKGMQLSLLYNGRKSPGNAPIHTGTAQVTAYF
ncbi:MAG: hypothetical protein Tsb0034_08610 [Ekhidna sp.]